METIDFNSMYFHGLAGNIITTDSDDLVIDTSLKSLESIILSGSILSRNSLKKININYSWKPVYNGDDYISLCVKNPDPSEFEGVNEFFYSSYEVYVAYNKIALIIDETIKNKNEFRQGEFSALPGERQVKDQIDFSDVVGISIMFENENKSLEALEKVEELLTKYNIDLPIVDHEFKVMNNSKKKL